LTNFLLNPNLSNINAIGVCCILVQKLFQVSMAVDLTDTWLREGIPASCRSLSTLMWSSRFLPVMVRATSLRATWAARMSALWASCSWLSRGRTRINFNRCQFCIHLSFYVFLKVILTEIHYRCQFYVNFSSHFSSQNTKSIKTRLKISSVLTRVQ
jgi:hypothetical protein